MLEIAGGLVGCQVAQRTQPGFQGPRAGGGVGPKGDTSNLFLFLQPSLSQLFPKRLLQTSSGM